MAWCCNTHITDKDACSMMYILDEDIKTAFLRMIRKQQTAHTQVLKPFVAGLKGTNNKERLHQVLALEEQIEKNAEQITVLTNLMSSGYIEPEIFHAEKNQLTLEADRLTREKQLISKSINGDLAHLDEAQKLLQFVSKKAEITEFEDEMFLEYVDTMTVHTRDTGIEDYVTVGEMSSTTLEHCIRYSGAEEKELSMCFNFHHLKVDYKDGNKWELMEPDYMELKVIFEKWQMGMQRGNAWNALFWCNHDQPRIVSRFGNEGEYWKESAKMLAGMIHLMRGTPYIYQGEEIGMTNPHYTSIEQYADVESRNYYEILLNEGKTKEEALEILAARSRDNSRTPMQWTDERYCGFSDTKPWIPVSDNFEKINVKKQKQDRDSILEFYKKLIMLRKEKEVIARGNIEFMEVENAGVLAYTRCLDKQKLLVCCNFRDVESQMEFTQEWKSGRKILGNYEENHKNNYKVLTLRPYEIIVLEKGEE